MARKPLMTVRMLKPGDEFTFLPAAHNLPGIVETSVAFDNAWKLVYTTPPTDYPRSWYGYKHTAVKRLRSADGTQS